MKKIIYLIITTVSIVFVASSIFAEDLLTEHVIKKNFNNACSIAGTDLDGDGDTDIVATSFDGNYIAWFENNGHQNFTEHRIISNFGNARVLDVGHIDDDDDYDIIATAGSNNKISWFENDGGGNFTEHIIIQNWMGSGFVMVRDHLNNIDLDIDGDGDTDILASAIPPGNRICWFENDGHQNFTERIIKSNWYWARYSTVNDIDQDGDMDVIGTAKTGEVIWFENDGAENFSENIIISGWGEPSSVQAADIDEDGDIDLAATSVVANQVAWFENDGNQIFTKHAIRSQFYGAFSVTITDIDFDNDYDILAVAWIGSLCSVFENDGEQNFTEYIFCHSAYDMIKIFPTDLDSDGDTDILGACYSDDDIRWWESNLYGFGFDCSVKAGHAPLTVQFFDHSKCADPITSRKWDFNNDGITDSQEQNPTYIYEESGTYTVTLNISGNNLSKTLTYDDYIHVFDGESALKFMESSSYGYCPASPAIDLANALTIEAWIKPTAWEAFANIVDKNNFSFLISGEGGALFDASLTIWHSTTDGSPGFICSPIASITLNEWQHVAVTYDSMNSEMKMYINGIEQTLTFFAGRPSGNIKDNSTVDLVFGNSTTHGRPLKGIIDEVRVWNIVRNAEEIQENMNHYLSGDENGLIGYWQMNEAFDTTFADKSGNGNDGILVNGSWAQGASFMTPTTINSADKISPENFVLLHNYPNPFNPETTISFDLPYKSHIRLAIYNITGKLVTTLISGDKTEGHYEIQWNGRDKHAQKVGSGVYFCVLKTEKQHQVKKMLLLE